MLKNDCKQYQGPTGEPLQVAGECPLQVCWQNNAEMKAKITFKVVVNLTFEMIITFEMAKATKMDLAAGPHPEHVGSNTVAPISSTMLPIRGLQQSIQDADLKAQKKKENERKEAERKRLQELSSS